MGTRIRASRLGGACYAGVTHGSTIPHPTPTPGIYQQNNPASRGINGKGSERAFVHFHDPRDEKAGVGLVQTSGELPSDGRKPCRRLGCHFDSSHLLRASTQGDSHCSDDGLGRLNHVGIWELQQPLARKLQRVTLVQVFNHLHFSAAVKCAPVGQNDEWRLVVPEVGSDNVLRVAAPDDLLGLRKWQASVL